MNWKNWPYWLRGGVIGTVFVLLSLGLSSLCLYHFTPSWSWGFECLPFALPTLPITFLLIPIANTLSTPALIFTIVLVYFAIGALIGRVIGYLKSKK